MFADLASNPLWSVQNQQVTHCLIARLLPICKQNKVSAQSQTASTIIHLSG